MKLGLALSGGGIRGIAHAGAIKALEDNGIKIDVIGGTSSGALVSSLYALGYSPYYIYILFKRYAKEIAGINSTPIISGIRSFMINKKIEIKGLRSGKNIEETYNCLALRKGVKKIEDIEKMPLVIPAVDVSDAKEYIFTNKIPQNSGDKYQYITDISNSIQKSGCVLKNKQKSSRHTNKMHKKMSDFEFKLNIHTVDFDTPYVIISLVKKFM